MGVEEASSWWVEKRRCGRCSWRAPCWSSRYPGGFCGEFWERSWKCRPVSRTLKCRRWGPWRRQIRTMDGVFWAFRRCARHQMSPVPRAVADWGAGGWAGRYSWRATWRKGQTRSCLQAAIKNYHRTNWWAGTGAGSARRPCWTSARHVRVYQVGNGLSLDRHDIQLHLVLQHRSTVE